MEGSEFGVRRVRIQGFRSARSVHFEPGPVCALVGGPSVGKSNVLAAIWTLLQGGAPAPARTDVSEGEGTSEDAVAGAGGGLSAAAGGARGAGGAGRAGGRVAGAISLSATLGDGDEISLQASPPQSPRGSGRGLPVLFLPASLRSGELLAGPVLSPRARRRWWRAWSGCARRASAGWCC